MPKHLAAEFVLLGAIWGSSFLLMRLGAGEFGPWATAGVRVLVASAVLLPLLWWRGQWATLRRHARPILFVGMLNSGLPFAFFAYALLHISTGLSAILNATVPLFGALIAWGWLGERPGRSRALGLAIGFAGVTLLSWNKASFTPGGTGWAVLACLGATVCYGIAASFTRRYLTGVAPLAVATGSQVGAALGLAVPTLWFWPAQTPGPVAWAALVAVGVVCTAFAYILFFRLIDQAGPSKTLSVTFLIPVFAVLYGTVLLDEPLTAWMLGGGAVILLGVALSSGLVSLPDRRRPANRAAPPP
jgi:drug/metabolite transporter (DMT)-like permease